MFSLQGRPNMTSGDCQAMAVSSFIYQRVPAEEGSIFRCPSGHSVTAAPTEYFAPQRIGPGLLLNVVNLANAGRLDVQLARQAEYDKRIEGCLDQKRVLYEQLILKHRES